MHRTMLGLAALAALGVLAFGQPAAVSEAPAEKPKTPTAADLIAKLNANARRVHTLSCSGVRLDVVQLNAAFGMFGQLVCQRSGQCRLTLKVAREPGIDLGWNERELWCWMRDRDQPELVVFKRCDLATGKQRLPMPFQPEWLFFCLGLGLYDADVESVVVEKPPKLELVQTVTPLRTVTVLTADEKNVQVHGCRIEDCRGKILLSVSGSKMWQDAHNSVVLPHIFEVEIPAEKTRMWLLLRDPVVNEAIDEERASRLFRRPTPEDLSGRPLGR